jgi:hypothetical protein
VLVGGSNRVETGRACCVRALFREAGDVSDDRLTPQWKRAATNVNGFQPFLEVQVSVYLPDLKSVVGSRLDE